MSISLFITILISLSIYSYIFYKLKNILTHYKDSKVNEAHTTKIETNPNLEKFINFKGHISKSTKDQLRSRKDKLKFCSIITSTLQMKREQTNQPSKYRERDKTVVELVNNPGRPYS